MLSIFTGPDVKRLFYRKSQRLISQSEFKQVLNHRICAGVGMLRLFVSPVSDRLSRLSISISKNVGTPVTRNRLKRLAREAFRLNQHNLPANLDYVLIISLKMTKKAKSEEPAMQTDMTYKQFETLFMGLVRRAIQKVN